MSTNEKVIGLSLTALDTLFFRDGRPFDASTQVQGGLPNPQTLAGALRTAVLTSLGFNFEKFREERKKNGTAPEVVIQSLLGDDWDWYRQLRLRGPFLSLSDDDGRIVPLLSVPNTLVRDKDSGKWACAQPKEDLPGWCSDVNDDFLPLWLDTCQQEKNPGGYLTINGVQKFLSDQANHITDADWFQPEELFGFDSRTGIAIDSSRLTAADSLIYAIRLLAMQPRIQRARLTSDPFDGWSAGFYCEVVLPENAPDLNSALRTVMPFGGEGRHVDVSPVDDSQRPKWPQPNASLTQSKWLLATPGIFGNTHTDDVWLPDVIGKDQIRAASCQSGVAVSGWDVAANGPRATRFSVPAGAVYYTEGFTPNGDSFCAQDEDRQQGWGFALQGVWK